MSISKNSKMLQFINYRMRIITDDGRTLVGRFIAFDKHMNVVLADCEEFRRAKKSEKDERRALGLTLLRGECLVSIAVESPPAKKKRTAEAAGLSTAARPDRGGASASGVGSGGAGGLHPSAPPPGLAGPAPGLGGAAVSVSAALRCRWPAGPAAAAAAAAAVRAGAAAAHAATTAASRHAATDAGVRPRRRHAAANPTVRPWSPAAATHAAWRPAAGLWQRKSWGIWTRWCVAKRVTWKVGVSVIVP